MTDEIYERLYGGTGEIVAEVTEPVADEEVIEEKLDNLSQEEISNL